MNQRGLFIIIGDRGRDQVVNLHYLLTKQQNKIKPKVLWCYKKELGFSSHRKKRAKEIKKL
jgi:N-acetyltransferase 10